jgi:hypothetical protein
LIKTTLDSSKSAVEAGLGADMQKPILTLPRFTYATRLALAYADFEEYGNDVKAVFECLSFDIKSSRGGDGVTTSPEQPLHLLAQDISDFKTLASRLACRLRHQIELSKQIVDFDETKSVRRLTLLASLFLPLSLSAGILSIDKRASQLGARLYDFSGIFCIFFLLMLLVSPVISVLMAYGEKVQDCKTRIRFSYRIPSDKWLLGLIRAMNRLFILLWFFLTISFIVGMSTNIQVGLIILGVGTGLGALSAIVVIGFFLWGLSRTRRESE